MRGELCFSCNFFDSSATVHVLRENEVCVQNDCPVAIRIRGYNVLHDKILHEISLFVRAHLAPSSSMVVDIGKGYAFPIHIII